MEYSAKYRVSISTLRRRIKAGELEFQFTDGKYLLKDIYMPVEPVSAVSQVVAPPTQAKQPQMQIVPSAPIMKIAPVAPIVPASPSHTNNHSSEVGPQVEKLLAEIKKAYMQILQEKEEQILLLRSEVSDLKTLVTVLEEQNHQLKNRREPVAHVTMPDPKFELDLDI